MACGMINHNVVKLVDNQALTVSGGATPSYTSTWYPVDGWVNKVIQVDADIASGALDLNVDLLVSPYDWYYMRSITATTEHYSTIAIKDAQTAVVLTRYDSSSVAALDSPMRSVAIKVTNDSATVAITSLTVWLEGQS